MFFEPPPQVVPSKSTQPSISYLCFTYIDFKENYSQDFTPDSLLEFFSITKKTLASYEDIKRKQGPCSYMTF